MLTNWRIQLREAEEALRAGRLDEAVGLVRDGDLPRYQPGKRLATAVAEQLARRGRERLLGGGDHHGGWNDLEIACLLGGQAETVLAVRREVVRQLLRDVEDALATAGPSVAVPRLERLLRHQDADEGVRTLLEVARRVASARHLQERGKLEEAELQLERAAALRPDLAAIQDEQRLCRQRREQSRQLTEQLHRALGQSDWNEVLAAADRLLEISPQSPLARDARQRAWAAVGARAPSVPGLVATQVCEPRGSGGSSDTNAGRADDSASSRPLQRALLWVDGVGGYLVCFDAEILLGQASPGNRVHVPIQGDLSRQHARIRREDGYLLEAQGRVKVEGKEIRGPVLLSDGDEIVLGESVRLRFRQPHALSATARLEFLSPHRCQPSCAGVLLMAESCVLGPKGQNHVVCRDWSSDVVLYQQEGGLYCRAKDGIEIDGHYCPEQGKLELDSHVTGSDFSLSLEKIA